MLTRNRRPVCLSLLALDLPVANSLETAATLFQNGPDRLHVLLSEPAIADFALPGLTTPPLPTERPRPNPPDRHLWLEISPTRAILTVQSNSGANYRHLWERGVYGLSRYWLTEQTHPNQPPQHHGEMRLRNFTRSLTLVGRPLPEHLRLEYELWAQNVALGRYVLNLEIFH